MQRKPGFPVANCSIKMPDSLPLSEMAVEEEEPHKRRQQLINFGHAQWGFNNWSWSVTKQDLDFVDLINGKYTAGVVAFVSITLKNLEIHRENIGYATAIGMQKGSAIHNARKCAVTNALRETLLSFGGSVATELLEQLDTMRQEATPPADPLPALKHSEPKNSPKLNLRKEAGDGPPAVRAPPAVPPVAPPAIKNAPPNPPPVAKAHPMPVAAPPANRPPPPANAPRPPAPHVRPNSNEAKLEDMTEEEARAERKRRQRVAQEEFRLKQLMKQKDLDVNHDSANNSSLDNLLMAIPTQDIIEETGNTDKRKSPSPEGVAAKRRIIN